MTTLIHSFKIRKAGYKLSIVNCHLSIILFFCSCASGKHQTRHQETIRKDSITAIRFRQKEKEEIWKDLISSSLTIRQFRFTAPDSTGKQFMEEYTELTNERARIIQEEIKETETEKEQMTHFESSHQTKEKEKKVNYPLSVKLLAIVVIIYFLCKRFLSGKA